MKISSRVCKNEKNINEVDVLFVMQRSAIFSTFVLKLHNCYHNLKSNKKYLKAADDSEIFKIWHLKQSYFVHDTVSKHIDWKLWQREMTHIILEDDLIHLKASLQIIISRNRNVFYKRNTEFIRLQNANENWNILSSYTRRSRFN